MGIGAGWGRMAGIDGVVMLLLQAGVRGGGSVGGKSGVVLVARAGWGTSSVVVGGGVWGVAVGAMVVSVVVVVGDIGGGVMVVVWGPGVWGGVRGGVGGIGGV